MTSSVQIGAGVATALPRKVKFEVGEIKSSKTDEPKSVTGQALGLVRNVAREEISVALGREDSSVQLLNLLSGTWARAIVIAEYANPDTHPPGVTEVVHLAEHELTVKAEVSVLISIDFVGETEVPLQLDITMGLKSVALSIRSGHIISIDFGEATAVTTLSIAGYQLHDELFPTEIQLGPMVTFEEGIAIPLMF